MRYATTRSGAPRAAAASRSASIAASAHCLWPLLSQRFRGDLFVPLDEAERVVDRRLGDRASYILVRAVACRRHRTPRALVLGRLVVAALVVRDAMRWWWEPNEPERKPSPERRWRWSPSGGTPVRARDPTTKDRRRPRPPGFVASSTTDDGPARSRRRRPRRRRSRRRRARTSYCARRRCSWRRAALFAAADADDDAAEDEGATASSLRGGSGHHVISRVIEGRDEESPLHNDGERWALAGVAPPERTCHRVAGRRSPLHNDG